MHQPRNEYPRPQFVRENWMCLNGAWDFSFDTDCFDRTIMVPFAYQTRLSGLHCREAHNTVWYRTTFTLPAAMQGKNILLHFGAVDYTCTVWVNGTHITRHEGGHVSFGAEITHALRGGGENELVVCAQDETRSLEQPRGKQFWEEETRSVFYTGTTGIWQSVWLEAVGTAYLTQVFLRPNIDRMCVDIEYELAADAHVVLEATLSLEGHPVCKMQLEAHGTGGHFCMDIDPRDIPGTCFVEQLYWTPENPRLFDLEYRVLLEGKEVDRVRSYVGMRKVSIEDGQFLLNNRPYYQKLVLDQGYWPDSLLTAPSDEALRRDILLAKEMGFNGARKHQKIEDPRYFYHADKEGFLVWGEMPSAYAYSSKYVSRITQEWTQAVLRDYNHPSLVVWVPLNESWGITAINEHRDVLHHSLAMVHLTKSLDPTRPVVGNDGWEQAETDLLTIHDYDASSEAVRLRYASLESILAFRPSGRRLFAQEYEYRGQPILVTEFGGISYQPTPEGTGWGYSGADTKEHFQAQYQAFVEALAASPHVQGFCFTQLYDIEQETNGLLTFSRENKVPAETICAINSLKEREPKPVFGL